MIFAVYNDHVIVLDNSDLSTPYIQTFNRPSDWFRNPMGFYLVLSADDKERAHYAFPPMGIKDTSAWKIDRTEFTDPPVSLCCSRGGTFIAFYKAGKKLLSSCFSCLDYRQNAVVSSDKSTSYIEVFSDLFRGEIKDIREFIQGLQTISCSSTQGSYISRAWYIPIDEFEECLKESGEGVFDKIDARWNLYSFEREKRIYSISLDDLKPFTYENLAGFEVEEQKDV